MRELETYLNEKSQRVNLQASILVAKGTEVLLNRSFGYADVEQEILLTSTTKYKICSITKQVVAALVLKFAQARKIDLHIPISAYLGLSYPGWGGAIPIWADHVTPHHLLVNCSGIPDYVSGLKFQSLLKTPHTKADILSRIVKQSLLFEPGTQYGYSNSGYVLLGEIIDYVSGCSFRDNLQNKILKPLNLGSTHMTVFQEGHATIKSDTSYAWGYARSRQAPDQLHLEGREFPASPFACYTLPDGSMFSTIEDLHKWNLALYSGEVIHPDFLSRMLMPHMRMVGTPAATENKKRELWYCYGIVRVFNPRLNTTFYRHGGIAGGFRSDLLYCPQTQVTVAVLSNAYWSDQKDDPLRDIRQLAYKLNELSNKII